MDFTGDFYISVVCFGITRKNLELRVQQQQHHKNIDLYFRDLLRFIGANAMNFDFYIELFV